MRIACPNCASEYALDERLLPPGGAPVQCTSCKHVFTAQASAALPVVTAAQAPTHDAPAAPGSGRRSTPAFGAPVQVPSDSPGRAAATQAFGLPAVSKPTQSGGDGPPVNKTQIFGARPDESRDPVRATQAFGLPAVSKPVPSGGEGPPVHKTQIFGSRPAEPKAPDRATHAYGLPAVSKPAAVHTTQVFGKAQPPAGPTSDAPATLAFGRSAELAKAPANQTMRFGAVPGGEATPFGDAEIAALRAAYDAGLQARSAGAAPAAGPGAAPAPHVTQIYGGKSHPAPAPQLLMSPSPEDLDVADAPGLVARKGKGRNWGVALVVGVAAIAVIAFFGVKLIDRLHEVPPGLISEEQAALGQDRLDDASSRDEVLAKLASLAAKSPRFVAPRADQALLLALRLDDVRAPLPVLDAESSEIDQDIAALTEAKSTSDWEVRVNALRARKRQLAEQTAAVEEDASARKTLLDRALAALPQATSDANAANLAVVRARGVAAGVEGSGAALELAERYTSLGDPGGWATLILAEYALNAHAPPETVDQVRRRLAALKSHDASFLRPYVLLARLALDADRPGDAASELEAVVALNPRHTLAHQLLDALTRAGAGSVHP